MDYLTRPDLKIGVLSCHEIACEHRLPYHQGKCRRRHGHNYKLEFAVFGPVQAGTHSSAGMVVDFSDLDQEIKGVLDQLDHYSLNDDLGLENPTAEHLAIWLLDHLPRVSRVTVWETSKHAATAERAANWTPEMLKQWEQQFTDKLTSKIKMQPSNIP